MKFKRKKKQDIKKVFIHIGFMKTGTSAFQSFLNDENNNDFLKKNDIYYPTINKKAQNYLAFSLMDSIPSKVQHILPVERNELYKNLVDEIKGSKESNILITSETYSLLTTNRFLGNKMPNIIYELLKDENFEIKIIILIRRQDEYLESLYNQIIKRHNFNNLYHKDIQSFYLENIDLFDYNKLINCWADVFGKDNLIIRLYKKEENSIINIFKAINNSIDVKEIKNEIINEKISDKTLEFLRIANKFEIDKNNGNQNNLLIKLIEDVFSNNSGISNRLTSQESKKIMGDYFEQNKLLSAIYFKGDFSWCNPKIIKYKTDTSIDEKIELEEAIKVTVKIWNHFQKLLAK